MSLHPKQAPSIPGPYALWTSSFLITGDPLEKCATSGSFCSPSLLQHPRGPRDTHGTSLASHACEAHLEFRPRLLGEPRLPMIDRPGSLRERFD
jgi:hypothetical protein